MNRKNSDENLQDLVLFSNSPGIPPDIASPTGALLEKMMIQMQDEGNMAEVQFALERSDKIIEKYRGSFWRYRILQPGPKMFIDSIKDQFAEEEAIRPLLKAFVYDRKEIQNSNYIYLLSIFLFIGSIISLTLIIFTKLYWLLIFPFLLCVNLTIQFFWFETIINESSFVPLYKMIRDAILRRIQSQQQFIEDTLGLRETVYKRYQEFEKNKVFNKLSSEEQKEFKRLELEATESLQVLAATVALYQAGSEEKIKQLRNDTNLDYLKRELNIRDEADEKARLHQIAIANINSNEKILVAQAKILGKDTQADRDMYREIQRNLSLLKGWKSSLSRKGNEGFKDIGNPVKEETENKSRNNTENSPRKSQDFYT